MVSLRASVIRLAHAKPELREHLLPLLREAGEIRDAPSEWDPEFDKLSTSQIEALLKIVFGKGWTARNDADGRKIIHVNPTTKKVEYFLGKGWSEAVRKAAVSINLTQVQFRERMSRHPTFRNLFRSAALESDRELVRTILGALPKRSSFMTFKVEDGQEQYWFDITYPFTDWTYKKGVSVHNERARNAYFVPLLKKLKAAVGVHGAVPVVREMSVVVVREGK